MKKQFLWFPFQPNYSFEPFFLVSALKGKRSADQVNKKNIKSATTAAILSIKMLFIFVIEQ